MSQQFEPFQKVLVRYRLDDTWKIELYSHYDETNFKHPYRGILSWYKYCIPYEGNEHLVGTNNSPTPPEPEFRFGDKVEVAQNQNGCWNKAVYICEDPVETKTFPHRCVLLRNHAVLNWAFCRKADW